MAYSVQVMFEPKFEFFASLHAYICRKSHKKIDLSTEWVNAARSRLTPSFAERLDRMEINQDWKLAFLLVILCPKPDIAGVIQWLQEMDADELYELLAPYKIFIPDDPAGLLETFLALFSAWNEQYFAFSGPEVLVPLLQEADRRKKEQQTLEQEEFVDMVTNGLAFSPVNGVTRLLLIPQYHFQPFNIIYSYNHLLVCSYSARIDLDQGDFMSVYDYRIVRSMAEKSRLKILKYLNGGPRSFIEIVRHLKLSKGITHDHISKLRAAGLVYAHFENENLTVYSLRLKGLAQMQEKVMAYISE